MPRDNVAILREQGHLRGVSLSQAEKDAINRMKPDQLDQLMNLARRIEREEPLRSMSDPLKRVFWKCWF